ncbi:MAG: PAS domain-containing sensor histidine kinase [Gammaproteobacteria bacterium]
MKLLYVAVWVVIIGFLVWSGNLLLKIQSMGSETAELHQLRLDLDSLAGAWRDLNRPGNDVLENYAVQEQRAALGHYKQRYDAIHEALQQRVQDDTALAPLIGDLTPARDTLVALAEQVLVLSEQREALRLLQAQAALISEQETAAASAMARMDQTFQDGMDVILQASAAVVGHERGLEELQRKNFQRLYIMLLVMLLASALSLELFRHSVRQREALRENAARIKTIVNNVVDGIITVDTDGAIESINQSAEQMFGYAANRVIGRQFVVLLRECCRKAYLNELRGGTTSHVIHPLLYAECEGFGQRRDGSTFPIELAISRVTLKGRQLLIHIVRDVTERMLADQKLRLAASVFENASEGIVITDVDGTIQSVNPAYRAITRFSEEELSGKNPRILQSGKHDRKFYERMWASISGAGHWQGEIWNRRKNGELFPQWVTINAIKDNRGQTTNYVGVAWDISELKASQRMQEEFITTISHELRTPLTSVLVSLGMLKTNMQEQLPEQAQKLITLAHSNSRRLVRLISDILDIEKIEAGKMTFQFEPLELSVLVNRVIEDSKGLAEQAQISITTQTPASTAWVNGDADRLMQALTNLLSNAIKYSPPGEPVEVVVSEQGPMFRIEVTDHGPGIPVEFHDQIFRKFAQVGRADRGEKAGTGLGLNIARLIVQQHGGRIDFQSTPGVRTTFCIDLPGAQQDSPTLKPGSIHASSESSRVARS